MPKSTVYRILRILQGHSYLHQDPESKKFRLGLAALQLGRNALGSIELRQAAARILEDLSERSGETVLLQVLTDERDQVVCIERAQQRSGLRILLEVGATAPLHAGSSSKVLLACMSDREIAAVLAHDLPALTTHTITDPAVLRAELERIRSDGYAVSLEETDIGAAGVSVPIRDHAGRVIAGLTIAGPTARLRPETIDGYIELARAAARQIGAQLGHHDPVAPAGPAASGLAR